MTVTPYCNHRFQTCRELYQFLSSCKQSLEKNQSSIISISVEVDAIDPLLVFQKLYQPDQLNFYFEKQDTRGSAELVGKGTAIAAIGSVADRHVEGADRFALAKEFIRSTLANVTSVGRSHLPLAGPHFFCSFTFDDHAGPSAVFPAATVFLPAWQISCQNDRSTVVANVVLNCDRPLEPTVDHVWQTLQTIRSIKYDFLSPAIDLRELLRTRDVTATSHFKQAVRAALHSIHEHLFHKIVLAHAVDITLPLPFDLVYSLHNLRRLYPDCYVFSASNGQGQQFVGASPERLVSLHDRQLLTDALAGSAPRGQTTYEDAHFANSLLNSAKEMHEHQVVTQFITRQLAQLNLAPQCSPLHLLQLSNIQHLRTPIHALVPAEIHLLDIVAQLHPTPAVAGMPRSIACEHIRQYELFERSLYAAPIGWVDQRGNGEFAVGIRSALINGCQARLYAGAGIVAGSDPDRELAEVQLKLQALLAALA